MSLFRYNPEIHDHPQFGRDQNGYDPNQPRVPKGHSDGGQWTSGGGEAPEASPNRLAFDASPAGTPAITSPPGTPVPQIPGAPGTQPQTPKPKIGGGAWGPALQLLNELLRRKLPEKPVGLEFRIRAREYSRDENDKEKLEFQPEKVLTPEEVSKYCPRLWVVQHLTNEAVKDVKNKQPDLEGGRLGSVIHHWIKSKADDDGISDKNFRFEISYLRTPNKPDPGPTDTANWGQPDTKRLDVLEYLPKKETVCIYDVKTGARGFQPGEMDQIAQLARQYYRNAKRFILIEVRPSGDAAKLME